MANEEKSNDELWDEAQRATDESDLDDIPDDDSDLLGDESAQTDPVIESDAESPAPSQFDLEAHLPRIAEYFQKEVLPSRDEQLLREAQHRARQSQKARDEQIKQQLAPLVAYLQQQEQQGMTTREDAERALQAAYRKANSEAENAERAKSDAELRQQWLARQQAQQQQQPAPMERPTWQVSTEMRMNQMLERSGLTDADPEMASVPLKITHDDPNEALDYFKVKVVTAVAEKNKRLQASAKPKPLIDMGTGGGAGAGNPLAGIEDPDQLWEIAQRGGY